MNTDTPEQRDATTLRDELPDEVREALEALDEHKAQDVVVLDMREVSGFTDFMLVCTGRSEPHVQALGDAVQERLLESRVKPSHVEGRQGGRWVLLDFLQLIVHVFTPEARAFYQLEKLWRDAPMLEWGVPDSGPAAPDTAPESPDPTG